jgi:tungstate transport system substrate-binding protein
MQRRTAFNLLLSLGLALLSACATATPAPTVAPTGAPAASAVPATGAATAAATSATTSAATATLPPATVIGTSSTVLRLATTTSTADTGLLNAILPDFNSKYSARVDVVAVGTGQALAIGVNGDADVVLVHARAQEDAFVAKGDGINRLDVMYNDFVNVGPKSDPAGIKGLASAVAAFTQIAQKGATFVSRGDKSGTNTKELSIWASAGITPTKANAWYLSIGQGMGDTLVFANEKQGYTLSDRGTWLATQANVPDLALLLGGATLADNKDKTLLNPYGVIPVNPAKHPNVNFALATQFANWITSVDEQAIIGNYGKDKFGQPLFYPSSAAWKAAHP